LEHDRLQRRHRRLRERRHLGRGAPEAADPDRVVRVALLELDPHAGADRRQHHDARLDARERHARHGPARPRQREHVRDLDLDPVLPLRVDVVDDRTAVLAVELRGAHAGTRGVIEIRPSRASWKLWWYSPGLIWWVTLLTK